MGMGVWAIVVAAGAGVRFGGSKQFRMLGGRRVIDRSVRVAAEQAEGVVVVVPGDRVAAVSEDAVSGRLPGGLRSAEVMVTAGGATRSASVRRGLARVPEDADVVLVHDGARPLADAGVYRRVVSAVRDGADVAVPVIDVVDALRWREGGGVDRGRVVSVQTPQGFRADVLRAAHAAGGDSHDDAGLAEALGAAVVLVDGDRCNLKITEPSDLAVAEALLRTRTGDDPDRPAASAADVNASPGGRIERPEYGDATRDGPSGGMRVGQGFDVHRYSDDPQRVLVLGGERFPGQRGLHGHSDADVVTHACMEALLAAAGLDDIGGMFPDSDPDLAGADSIELLRRAAAAVRASGWHVVNVSCAVVLDVPKLSPRRDAIQNRMSRAAGAPVTVTGRRSESVGSLGRGEGVAAWAVALLSRGPSGPGACSPL